MPQIAMACICCGATLQDKQSAVLMPFVAKRGARYEPGYRARNARLVAGDGRRQRQHEPSTSSVCVP